jgi:hypothetical protein
MEDEGDMIAEVTRRFTKKKSDDQQKASIPVSNAVAVGDPSCQTTINLSFRDLYQKCIPRFLEGAPVCFVNSPSQETTADLVDDYNPFIDGGKFLAIWFLIISRIF